MYLVRELDGEYIIAGDRKNSLFFKHLQQIPNYLVSYNGDYFRIRSCYIDLKLPLEFFLTERNEDE